MKIHLPLPSLPGFSIPNVVLAAYAIYSLLKYLSTRFIVSYVFLDKALPLKRGAIFCFAPVWRYRSQKCSFALIIRVEKLVILLKFPWKGNGDTRKLLNCKYHLTIGSKALWLINCTSYNHLPYKTKFVNHEEDLLAS
jgi:hypothetical protein